MAARGKLPNLKICVDNTESTDESDVSLHESGSYSSEEEYDRKFEDSKKTVDLKERQGLEDDVLSIGETEPTVRKFLSRGIPSGGNSQNYGPKIYENKTGNFVTGVDVTSEEAQEMRDKRAQRFGTLSTPKHPITDVDIKNLYRSLGLSVDKLAEDPRGWRLEAILLRGTENMSTEDVFKYFSEFGPKSIEWIDDYSCNVLWADKLTPARALLRLSSTMDEVHLTEKIVDNQMEDQEEAIQKNEDGISQDNAPISGSDNRSENMPSNTQALSSMKDNIVHEEPLAKEKPDTAVPEVLAGDEIAMELDFDDDNIDLTADDPIDQAMSTWSNFTQDKERRAQRRASDAAAAKSRHDEKLSEKKDVAFMKEKGELEALSSEGEKQLKEPHKTSEKEKKASSLKEKDEDEARYDAAEEDNRMTSHKTSEKEKKASSLKEKDEDEARYDAAEEDNRMTSHKKAGKEKNAKTGSQVSKKKSMNVDIIKIKKEKGKGEKVKKGSGKAEKMEADGDGSDSDSSGSSSSSSSGSSGSSSESGSDSSSGSSSSSSSSSSCGNSSEGSKKKKLKSRLERDKERALKKTMKKPETPPVIPQVKEKSEIPWPPGFWRLGMPFAKAEYLFMRYAMKADKKLPGAEKKSEYYKKYGNPNFGGITGLISNSRKRRLRQANRAEEDANAGDSGSFKEEVLVAGNRPQKSRLAGRLGVREQGKRAHSDDNEGIEDRNKLPTLREGKDLRDLLNGDPTAVKDETDTNPGTKAASVKDSDDEMDYGAELERLMANDEDEGPPIKKRFMRMHADDEEAKMKSKRSAKTAMHSPTWQKDMYEEERRLYFDDEDQEGEDYEEQIRYPTFEERNPLAGQKRRGYVDYDNVEDDDPFNLFGTTAPKETLPGVTSRLYDSDEENDENDFERRYYSGSRGFTEADDRTRERREHRWKNSWEEGGGGNRAGGDGLDLRAKLQAKRRAGNRNW